MNLSFQNGLQKKKRGSKKEQKGKGSSFAINLVPATLENHFCKNFCGEHLWYDVYTEAKELRVIKKVRTL